MNSELVPAGETTALAVRSGNPFDGNVVEFKSALARRGENRGTLIDWVRSSLVDGVDYGRIHTKKKTECRHGSNCTPDIEPSHWSKPSLRKPGAEKICGMLGVIPTFPTLKNYEDLALQGIPIDQIILRCHLLSQGGDVLADGVGARSVKTDYGDLNKSLKMALKSAHIDATLRMAGLSEIFTQDLEDMKAAEEQRERDRGNATRDTGHDRPTSAATQQAAAGKPQTQAPRSTGGRGFATEKQVMLIERRLGEASVRPDELCEWLGINSLTEIPFARVNEVLDWIANGDRETKAVLNDKADRW